MFLVTEKIPQAPRPAPVPRPYRPSSGSAVHPGGVSPATSAEPRSPAAEDEHAGPGTGDDRRVARARAAGRLRASESGIAAAALAAGAAGRRWPRAAAPGRGQRVHQQRRAAGVEGGVARAARRRAAARGRRASTGSPRARGRRAGSPGSTSSRTARARRRRSRTASRRRAGRARRCPGGPPARRSGASTRVLVDASTSGQSAQAPQHAGDDGGGRGAHPPALRDAVVGDDAQPGRRPAQLARRRPGTRGRPGATRRWAARPRPIAGDRDLQPGGQDGELEDVVAVSASPAQSNAGPRLALVAGTRTPDRGRRPSQAQLRGGGRGVDRDGHAAPARPEMAHSGSLRPLPVTVQTTRWPGSSSPAAATCSRPATEAADAGSTNTASLRASSR